MKNNLATTRNLTTVSVKKDEETFFNNLYQNPLAVTTDQDSAIQTYFEQLTGDVNAARLLSTSVIFTAKLQNINPMTVVADLKKLPPGQLNLTLATFLNFNRSNTSLLGTTNTPKTGFYVQRSILV
jgi:hypothetical protein